MNKLYTAQEIADKLKIKKTTVYDLIKRGELSSSKVGKQLRISEEQLEQYLHNSPQSFCDAELYQPDFQPESSILKRDYLLHSNGLILSGQTSPALELLLTQMAVHPGGMPVLQSHMNSYNGLYSLYFGKVHIASASMKPEDISRLVPGIPLALVCLYEYPIGFYVSRGNPRHITGFQDLSRADVILANREKGSTRRIFLDYGLKEACISPDMVSGYRNELVSDLSTAVAVISQKADTAIGEGAVARQAGNLDFIPLGVLPMYLVMEADSLEKPGFSALLKIVHSEDFRTGLYNQTRYDITHTGEILYL